MQGVWRNCSTVAVPLTRQYNAMASQLIFSAHGQPQQVTSLKPIQLPTLKDDQLLIDVLAAPINPSDINQIEGKYPIKPTLPAVPGNEGVGRVREVGSKVAGVSVGDWVIPRRPALGLWRQAGTFSAADWKVVPNTLPVEAAATIYVNPPTALRMLEEYVHLQPGDSVIQNGANSAVGQYVIQMAKSKGLKTINIIRDRPNMGEVAGELTELGADLVTTEDRLKSDMEASGLPRPRLGLNCVGGSAATAVAKALANGGTLVTYGGMSLQPLTIPTSLFIFKDLRCRGFWLSQTNERGGEDDRVDVIDQIADMYVKGALKPSRTTAVPLDQYKDAFDKYYSGFQGTKLMFVPNPDLR